MKPFAVTCRAIAIAAVLLSGALSAHAARRSGTALDDASHASTPLARPAAVAPHAASSDDDAPCLKPCPSSTSSTQTSRLDANRTTPRPTMPASSDARGEKRERGRTTPNGIAQVHRPAAQRTRGHVRNTPATPGMGLLLRFGTNAGQEISLNADDSGFSPASVRSGRAPPRAGPHSTFAPAALPRCFALATPSRAQRPTPPAGAPQQISTTTTDDRFAPRRFRVPAVHASGMTAALAASFIGFTPGRLPRPHAACVKGAAACIPPPFGGRFA